MLLRVAFHKTGRLAFALRVIYRFTSLVTKNMFRVGIQEGEGGF